MVRKASGKDGMGQAEILASPLLEIDLVLVRLNHVASKRLTSESAANASCNRLQSVDAIRLF